VVKALARLTASPWSAGAIATIRRQLGRGRCSRTLRVP
jgi:hypothetical protein